MTAIRTWTGSAWKPQKFCTSKATGIFDSPDFKGYKAEVPAIPAVPGVPVGNWDFYSDEGWRYYDGVGYNGVPGSTGAELMLGKTTPNQTPWTVSPQLSQEQLQPMKYKNLLGQMSVRIEHYSGGLGSTGIDVYMIADFGGPLQEDQTHSEVWGTTGNWVMTGDYPLQIWSWDSPRLYVYSYCGDTSANWMMFVDWARFIDAATGQPCYTAGTPEVPAVPGYYPNYWNGSAWVAQNEA